jgi:hypothetical protein
MKIVYRFFKNELFKRQKDKLNAYKHTFNKDYGRYVLADLLKEMNFYHISKTNLNSQNSIVLRK